jgi:hypothetical protein
MSTVDSCRGASCEMHTRLEKRSIGCWNVRAADTNDLLGWVQFDLRARVWRTYTVPTGWVHAIELDRRLFRHRAVALVLEWHSRLHPFHRDGGQ